MCSLSATSAQTLNVGEAAAASASCTDTATGTLEYRFAVSPAESALPVLHDYDTSTTFGWTPMQEGSYQLTLTARNRTTQQTGSTSIAFTVRSRIGPDSAPVITATSNPLVFLYSAPPCNSGSMDVMFRVSGTPARSPSQRTPPLPCTPNLSRNFLIAGLLPNTAYVMRYQITQQEPPGKTAHRGSTVRLGPLSAPVQTGTPGVTLPSFQIMGLPDSHTSQAEKVLLQSFLAYGGPAGTTSKPMATDLQGRLIWYFDAPSTFAYLIRPIAGGTFLGLPNLQEHLAEFDLAGNTLRDTNITVLTEQLRQLGFTDNIIGLHHDAVRLPNGNTAVLANADRILPEQGGKDVVGDLVLVLDNNWQVIWVWNSFDHLDTHRLAVLKETCPSGQQGCPFLTPPNQVANDWTHANSLQYLPDGNFLVSLRHQDWVVKINYADGAGSGSIMWRLGIQGDFTLANSNVDVFPWFSHQHDVSLLGNLLIALDNGDTRVVTSTTAQGPQHSRGQAYVLDDSTPGKFTATLVLNADLGAYSNRIGSAQLLVNGNFHFLLGALDPGSESIEIYPSGFLVSTMNYRFGYLQNLAYRSFRLPDLYSAP